MTIFRTPYDQYREHNGKTCVVLEELSHATHPATLDEEVGSLFRIRLEDGTEIDAWPEELTEEPTP